MGWWLWVKLHSAGTALNKENDIFLYNSSLLASLYILFVLNLLNSWYNNVLQESIRNSADRPLLSAPDSLTVSVSKEDVTAEIKKESTQPNFGSHNLGIDSLDKLCFSYKVCLQFFLFQIIYLYLLWL